jgi:hypothetical protein
VTRSTLNRLFEALFVAFVILGALRFAGVIGESVVVIVTVVTAIGGMLFLAVLGASTLLRATMAVMLVALLGLVPNWAPTQATANFYVATAQIIPVLLLALALELRLFRVPFTAAGRRDD